MKLYLISQDKNNNYDTYDAAVVCCNTAEEARMTHPSGANWDGKTKRWDSWVDCNDVTVTYLGEADPSVKPGVVCASFNAG